MASTTVQVGSHKVIQKRRLGEGGFGFVDLVTDYFNHDQEYVLKRCSVEQNKDMAIFRREEEMLRRFQGPYVVKLIAADVMAISNGKPVGCLLLEYCPGDDLFKRLNRRFREKSPPEPWPLRSICKIFGEVLLALKPMHEANPAVVHRDLKVRLWPAWRSLSLVREFLTSRHTNRHAVMHHNLKLENILVGPDNSIRLCDFGSAVVGRIPLRTVEERTSYREDKVRRAVRAASRDHAIRLTPPPCHFHPINAAQENATTAIYRAPELQTLAPRCGFLTEKTDIWALGCIFYQLCFFRHPFETTTRVTFPARHGLGTDVEAFLMYTFDPDPEARPSIAQLLPMAQVGLGPAWNQRFLAHIQACQPPNPHTHTHTLTHPHSPTHTHTHPPTAPTVAQALHQHQPLPPYEVPPEVLVIRRDREVRPLLARLEMRRVRGKASHIQTHQPIALAIRRDR